MHRYDLLQLTDQNSFTYRNFKDRMDFANMHFPVAEKLTESTVWVAHQYFLGDTDLVDFFVEALERVREQSSEVKAFFEAREAKPTGAAHLRT